LPGVCHDLRHEYHGVHVASVHTIIKHIYRHISQLFYHTSTESKPESAGKKPQDVKNPQKWHYC